MRDDLKHTPERDQVHKPWCQPARKVFFTAANANQKVHRKKGKDANLKGLKRPGIPNKDGCCRKNKQEQQTRAYNYWREPVRSVCLVI
jgi:hypothetical protein